MAAANFSRDVLEQNQTITTDLIDLETIIETPQQEEKKAPQFLNSELQKFINREFEKYLEETRDVPIFARGKIYNHCDWLKIGKKDRCRSAANNFIAAPTVIGYISKGVEIPFPCITCGVGVRRINQLCTRCEREICNKKR